MSTTARRTNEELRARPDSKHCDEYIKDKTQPLCLRRFLRYNRWPAIYKVRAKRLKVKTPVLYADFTEWKHRNPEKDQKRRVRVVMASRFGDVGITFDLTKEYGYTWRVMVSELSNFSETP